MTVPRTAHAQTIDDKPASWATLQSASTFDPAIRLLPSDLRTDAQRLYRLLRTIDDLVDEGDPQATRRVDAIEKWTQGQHCETPETRILADLSRRHALPRDSVLEFCEGMRHDLAGAHVETEVELERYCQYVGGSVGVILTSMFGAEHPDCVSKMAALGRAFQRTNILRDVDEDREHGREYIARSTIEQFGLPSPGAREALLRNQIGIADQLYEEGLGAIPMLSRGRRGMALSADLYRAILRQIEREGFGRAPGRVAVPRWRRQLLIAKHHVKPAYSDTSRVNDL
jgi:15-cis-phytoene synthase